MLQPKQYFVKSFRYACDASIELQLAEFDSDLIEGGSFWFVLIHATDWEDFFSFLPKTGVRGKKCLKSDPKNNR